ncbi:MAG: hypothetical protein JXB32_14915 [Deltaproteobacteria bacterium]|nr:hypothetical protein [Deltaproteobacteria bacterium]
MAQRFAEQAVAALRALGATAAPGDEAVGSVMVRVGDAEGGALVTLERAGTGVRAACTCGRPGCEHVASVLALLGATAPASVPRPPVVPTVPPPRPTSVPAAARACGERPDDAAIAERLRRLLEVLVEDGAAVGSERTDAMLAEVVRFLYATDAYGLHRVLADLRREIGTARPSPDRLLRAVELLEATCLVLERRAGGRPVEPGVYELLVGRDRPLGELQTREDLTLLEVARNSARTPFGYRRAERFLVDLATGARYTELVAVAIEADFPAGGMRYAGSVGPFPRRVRADLAAVEPGPSPQRIRLLQYHVEPEPHAEDLRRLASAAVRDVGALYAEFEALAEQVGVAYPCFVLFAPARVVFLDGEATLVDAEDRVLPLARAVAPDTCAAADRFLTRGRVELVVGHVLLLRRMLALSPLSLLTDSPRGERLLRLR